MPSEAPKPEGDTKRRILDAALSRFNDRGLVNVTLRDIAADVGISPGNLAYHFRNKDALVSALFERLNTELNRLVSGVRLIPSFENIDQQLDPFFRFQLAHRFLYVDTLEFCRAYPVLAQAHRESVRRQIGNLRAIVDYSVGSGNMEEEPYDGAYDQLAHLAWMMLSLWILQDEIRGVDRSDPARAHRALWHLVIPHLSAKGRHNFQAVAERYGLDLPVEQAPITPPKS